MPASKGYTVRGLQQPAEECAPFNLPPPQEWPLLLWPRGPLQQWKACGRDPARGCCDPWAARLCGQGCGGWVRVARWACSGDGTTKGKAAAGKAEQATTCHATFRRSRPALPACSLSTPWQQPPCLSPVSFVPFVLPCCLRLQNTPSNPITWLEHLPCAPPPCSSRPPARPHPPRPAAGLRPLLAGCTRRSAPAPPTAAPQCSAPAGRGCAPPRPASPARWAQGPGGCSTRR